MTISDIDRAALLAPVERAQPVRPTLPDPKGGCTCWLPPEEWDTSYYGIAEPGSQMEYDPACPEHSDHLYDPRSGEWVFRSVRDESEPVRFGSTFSQLQARGFLPTAEEVAAAQFAETAHPFTVCGYDPAAA